MPPSKLLMLSRLTALLVVLLAVGGVQAQATVDVIVFRSPDSLTLYFPSSVPVNINGFSIEATTATGSNLRQVLENLPAFRGLPYDRLPTPLCFRIIRVSSIDPFALECQTTTTLTQTLIDANVFWYDRVAQQDRTLLLALGDRVLLCPAGQARCDLRFPMQPIHILANDDWTPVERDFDGVPMVLVPAGCFMMGSTEEQVEAAYQTALEVDSSFQRERFERELPQHQQCINAPFWIDKTEVTNRQYQTFIDAGGYSNRGYWTDDGWTWRIENDIAQPLYWIDNQYNAPDQPVVGVNWYEAVAFAAWRGGRLPSEMEWEYTARGPSNVVYPWGNAFDGMRLNYCDSNCEFNLRDTVEDDGFGEVAFVGRYPAGASWVGALDMSGNVREWTNTIYANYPYEQSDESEGFTGTDSRSARGGSWDDDEVRVRAASRGRFIPYDRLNAQGFRVVLLFFQDR
jgi:formylglycine-generating enzyme required for sulfatase activity